MRDIGDYLAEKEVCGSGRKALKRAALGVCLIFGGFLLVGGSFFFSVVGAVLAAYGLHLVLE